jgi:prefoldin subunit 5
MGWFKKTPKSSPERLEGQIDEIKKDIKELETQKEEVKEQKNSVDQVEDYFNHRGQ